MLRETLAEKMAKCKNVWPSIIGGKGSGTPLQYSCLENPRDGGAWRAAVYGVTKSWTRLSNFTFTFHFYALEKEMATHSSVLAWRIPGTGSLVGCHLWGRTESDTTEATWQQQHNRNTSDYTYPYCLLCLFKFCKKFSKSLFKQRSVLHSPALVGRERLVVALWCRSFSCGDERKSCNQICSGPFTGKESSSSL